MPERTNNFLNTINARILLVASVLFVAVAGVIGIVNNINIRKLYEETYTERLLLTNALMGSFIQNENVEYFVDLLKNQDDGLKKRQVDFFHNREELFRLQEEGATEEEQQEVLARLAAFHDEMHAFKDEKYWDTLAELKELKRLSGSTYVYVMTDVGLKSRDGEPLFTYIFDAEDQGEYNSPDMDGLGTSDTGNEAFTNVFLTKKQTEKAEHYEGVFGDLYFVCVPILNNNGDVIAVLGTDLSLENMNSAIASSTALFNNIIIAVFIASVIIIIVLLSRGIARPLSSLTETALAFAEGNLHSPISESALRQRTEIGTLAKAIKSTLDATTLYLNSIPESLFIMNRDCKTYFRNEQFVKRFGDMQAKEFVSALFLADAGEELEKRLRQEGSVTTAWIDGSCFAVMLKEIALSNMPENSILVIANDITDLMREKENAQAAAAAKSRFLSRMSHEMRTPMNAIMGMSKVAGDSHNIYNIKHCLSIISASSEQLLNIINDVLDMSKIEAGKLELKNAPMNIKKILTEVSDIIKDTAWKKKQTFNSVLSGDLQTHYFADELRLSQVLTNLLSNAVKFTPEGGEITLKAERVLKDRDADVLRFCVSDTGIGMTVGQMESLFNAFEQADGSIARRYGGTGLGLAISQSIVEKMGGHITVDSKPGAGAEFSFEIRLEYAPAQDIHDNIDGGGKAPDLSGVRVLLAEDIEINREIFLALIESTNISTDIAENGREAVSMFKENPERYDLIIMDIQMPEMDGYEATKAIRSMDTPRAKTIPIMAMSANAFKEDIDLCLECGMDDHLAKPIDINIVIDTIVRYLNIDGDN